MKKIKEEQKFNNPAKSSPDIKKIKAEKKPQRKAKKKEKRMHRYGRIFNVLHGLFSLLFVVLVFMLNILPFTYTVCVVLGVALLFLITVLTQKRKKAARIIGRIYSTLVMLALVVGSVSLGAANYVLGSVTGAPLEKKEKEFDLLNSDVSFSITEDSYCVYVKDTSAEDELLVVVNPDTRQLLCIETPGDYFVTIPKVSKGQRERLIQAREYGVEATIGALSNLYETEISYYVEMDSEWLESMSSPVNIIHGVPVAGEHVQTSFSKYEVQQLIQVQISDSSAWMKHVEAVTGTAETAYTFTSPDTRVTVMMPDQVTVDEMIDLIDRVEDDEILEDETSSGDRPAIVIP